MAENVADASLRVLLAFYEENARQARYHGARRHAVTATVALAMVLLLGAVLISAVGDAGLVLCGLVLGALGTWGFLASLHHHERGRLHVERLHAVREAMWEEFPGGVGDLYGAANEKHRARFPVFSEKTARIHWAWQLVHVMAVAAGVVLVLAGLLGAAL